MRHFLSRTRMGRRQVFVACLLGAGVTALILGGVFYSTQSDSFNTSISRHSHTDAADRKPAAETPVTKTPSVAVPADHSLPWAQILQGKAVDPQDARAALSKGKSSQKNEIARGRKMALAHLGKESAEGVQYIPGLVLYPTTRATKETDAAAEWVDGSWAIYDAADVKSKGWPAVYDFQNNRWGTYSGMVEVPVDASADYDRMATSIENSTGFKVVKLPSGKGNLYVAVDARSPTELEAARSELEKKLGLANAHPEVVYTWRNPL